MAINTLAVATKFMTALDKAFVQEAVTGWMDANAGQVQYDGGKYVKVPQLSTNGLADYDRDDGFVQGAVTLTYEQLEMTQDRGRKFQLDAMDVNEANFIPTAAAVMGEFQRTQVVPEIDAYRISKVVTNAISASQAGLIDYGYTPGESGTSALRKFKEAVAAIRANGYSGPLVAHVTALFKLELELELAGKITTVTFSQGGIQTQVPAIDNIPLIETSNDRMVSAIQTYDGTTSSQKAGGFVKASTGKDVNFVIMPNTAPMAVSKQDKMRIFTPDTYQKADAWAMDYRRFHDLWVLEEKAKVIAVSIKDAQ